MPDAGDLTRRQALAQLAAATVAGLSIPGAAAQQISSNALDAYIDVLLPGGDGLPPASDLGIAVEVELLAADGSTFARLLAAATRWLDGLGPQGFAALPQAARTEVVARLATAPYNEIPGRFHHVVRLLACELYYARPEARAGLPLQVAPQPAGYLPPWGEA